MGTWVGKEGLHFFYLFKGNTGNLNAQSLSFDGTGAIDKGCMNDIQNPIKAKREIFRFPAWRAARQRCQWHSNGVLPCPYPTSLAIPSCA